MKALVLLVLLALTTTGCLSNMAKVIREVAKSDRSWCVAATGYGVNIKAGGSGVGEGDMSCTDGGLSLKSQATQIGVPLTIIPQLSVGAPTVAIPPPPPPRPTPPRVIPQSGGGDDVTLLRPIAWQPAEPRPAPTPLTADERLLLFSIGDLHRRGP